MDVFTAESALPSSIFSRRKLLLLAGCAVVAMALPGCGGGGTSIGSGGGQISMASYSGRVVLPPGVSASSLVVAGGLTTSTIQNGGFNLPAPSDAPSLITVCNPTTQQAVLYGMTYPGGGGLVIDNNSSATALLFIALGGSTVTRDGMQPLLNAINSSSQVATLASVIETQQLTDPYAIANGNAQIVAALSAAAQALGPGINSGLSTKNPGQTAQGSAPTQLLLQPSDQVNGVTFINLSDPTGFNVLNAKRRMGYVYTYLTGHFDSSGNKTAVSPPSQSGSVLFVPSSASLLSLTKGWSPSTSANVALNLQGSDTQTAYTMVYLTQVYAASDPPFFSDPAWAGEISKWRTTLSQLGANTFCGFFANFILSAIGFAGLTWTDVQLGACVTQLQTVPSVATLLESAAQGSTSLSALTQSWVQLARAEYITPSVLQPIAQLAEVASAQAATYLETVAASVTALGALTAALAGLIIAGALALSADLAAIALDTSTGDRGDLWTGTVFQPTVTVNPQNPNAKPGDSIAFTAKVPTGTTGTITYAWSNTSPFAQFSDGNGTNGNPITTSSSAVTLITTPSDQGSITVSVTAYSTVNGTKSTVGTATTTVNFQGGNGNNGSGWGTLAVTFTGVPASVTANEGIHNTTYNVTILGNLRGTNWEGLGAGNTLDVNTPQGQGGYTFSMSAYSVSPNIVGTYPLNNQANPVYPFFSYADGAANWPTGTLSITNPGGGKLNFTFTISNPNGDGTTMVATGSGTLNISA